jgi:hypothetical protein
LIRRIKDYRFGWRYSKDETVADNFYPVNSVISIRDKERVFSVWNDRSQAATSINAGEIYMNLNRKSTRDDKRGLADGLNETRNSLGNTRYNHLITIGKNFCQKNVNRLVNKKPAIMDITQFNPNTEANNFLKMQNILNNITSNDLETLVIKETQSNCFDNDFYIVEQNKFLLQITNAFSEPYFNKELRTCDFEFNAKLVQNFKIHEVELNGITPVPSPFLKANTVIHHLRGFTSFRESISVFRQYTLHPYESKTFMFEFI